MANGILLKRDDLYKLVWSEPVDRLARRYGISGVALAKICRKLGVPCPPRGYWARDAAGHKGSHPPLPALKEGQPTEHRISAANEGGSVRFSDEVERQLEMETMPGSKVVVPDVLADPHPFVRLSEPLLRRKPAKGYYPTYERRCLDIHVSGPVLDRAFRIMDSILKALERRGLTVELTEPKKGPPRPGYSEPETTPSVTGVRVSGTLVEFGVLFRRSLPV